MSSEPANCEPLVELTRAWSYDKLVQRRRRPIFGFFRWLCMHNVARRIRKHRRAAVVAKFERKAVCVSNRLT
jgi:hypothetical protein